MMDTYSRACTEVVVILKNYLSKAEFDKIPREKMEFFEKNQDKNYDYKIDKNLPFPKQNISEMANSIIITIYRDYFASHKQKETLNRILILNDTKKEKQKKNDYSSNVFENVETKKTTTEITESKALIKVEKDGLFKKIKEFIKYVIEKVKNQKGENLR